MTFLDLCKVVHLILRVGEETPGTQPVAVTGQSGQLAEIVEYVKRSHADICRLHPNWLFMQASGTVSLTVGSRKVTKAALLAAYPNLGRVMPFVVNDGAYLGITPDGESAEQTVIHVSYQDWIGNYDAPPIPSGMPRHFTITPDGDIEFDANADRAYSIRFMYRKRVVDLAADGDQPMFDEDYHMLIPWWAVRRYYCASRDSTNELLQKSDVEMRRELHRMRNDLLPDFTLM